MRARRWPPARPNPKTVEASRHAARRHVARRSDSRGGDAEPAAAAAAAATVGAFPIAGSSVAETPLDRRYSRRDDTRVQSTCMCRAGRIAIRGREPSADPPRPPRLIRFSCSVASVSCLLDLLEVTVFKKLLIIFSLFGDKILMRRWCRALGHDGDCC